MSTDRETTRIVRSWLEEGVTALPDRVLDAVLDQVPATSQRRPMWPARRFREMNNALKVAIAAAAVVVVALVGINLLPGSGGVGGPGPSPASNPTQSRPPMQTPEPTPTPTPAPSGNFNFTGDYVAGTTYVIEDPCCVAPSRMTFTMAATGWYAPLEAWRIGKDVPGGSDIFDLFVTPYLVENIYTGGCHWRGTEHNPPVGPTVDDLATALSAQVVNGASPATDVTVGGHPGKKVELQIPEDLDMTTCDSDGGGSDPIFGRFVFDRGFSAAPYTHGNGQHDTIYIVDVDGVRQVIDAMYLPNASAADRAEQDQIVASIRFEQPGASPSPSP
jgi:hypothetical protein